MKVIDEVVLVKERFKMVCEKVIVVLNLDVFFIFDCIVVFCYCVMVIIFEVLENFLMVLIECRYCFRSLYFLGVV